MCWWNHTEQQRSETIQCFVCNETFVNKPDMMLHRKKRHSEIIRQCSQFNQNSCRFQEEACWFKHDIELREEEETDEPSNKQSSVFQKEQINQKPPIANQSSPGRQNQERI